MAESVGNRSAQRTHGRSWLSGRRQNKRRPMGEGAAVPTIQEGEEEEEPTLADPARTTPTQHIRKEIVEPGITGEDDNHAKL